MIPRPYPSANDIIPMSHFGEISREDVETVVQSLVLKTHSTIQYPGCIPASISNLFDKNNTSDIPPASQLLSPLALQVLAEYTPTNIEKTTTVENTTATTPTSIIDIAKQEISNHLTHHKRKLPLHHTPVDIGPNKRVTLEQQQQQPPPPDLHDTPIPNIDRNAKLITQLQDVIDTLLDSENDDFNNRPNLWWLYSPTSSYVWAEPVALELETLIVRAQDAGVLSLVPFDDLLRIQRMAIDHCWKFVHSLTHTIPIDNVPQLAILQASMISGKIILRSMMHENTQLCSEESISSIIDGINLIHQQFISKVLLDSSSKLLPPQSSLLVTRLVQHLTQLVSLVSNLVDHHDSLSDRIVTSLEYMSLAIAFMDSGGGVGSNSSALESLRLASMDVISTLFTNYPDQRSFLLDEILSSWQKLPAGRQNARQFRIGNGSSIQMITVLMMRLVQTCGLGTRHHLDDFVTGANHAYKVSNEITWFIISKATRASKTGDVPFRLLMELFAQDLLWVLIKPEWPASQILLVSLISGLISGCCENFEKTPAQVTNAALEILGNIENDMGKIRSSGGGGVGGSDNDDAMASQRQLYQPVLTYLHNLSIHDSLARGSEGILMCLWMDNVFKNAANRESNSLDLQAQEEFLVNMYTNKNDFSFDYEIICKNYQQIIVSSPLFALYRPLLDSVLRALGHPKPTVRGRALRVFGIFLSNNPTILSDSNVKLSVVASLLDQSPTGRDAAVDMISKYLIANPSLGLEFYPVICDRSNDTSTAVRKRVAKLLGEIAKNLSMDHIDVKVYIIDRLFKRLDDEESSVCEIVSKVLGDLLFFECNDLHDSMMVLVNLVRGSSEKSTRNGGYLNRLISSLGSRSTPHQTKIMHLVFEEMISATTTTTGISREMYLKLAQVLCQSGTPLGEDQLVVIENYLATTGGANDDALVVPCLLIVKDIIPTTMDKSSRLVKQVKQTLFQKLSRYNVRQLAIAVPCLWELCVMSNDTKRLAVTLKSCLVSLDPFLKNDLSNPNMTREKRAKMIRLLHIVGHLGRYCDLQEYLFMFTDQKQQDLPRLLTRIFAQIASTTITGTISRIGLRNLGMVCISHPTLFLEPENLKVFDEAIKPRGKCETKENMLRILSEFLQSEELKVHKKTEGKKKNQQVVVDIGVLKGDSAKFSEDGVCASLIQRYMQEILNTCLERVDYPSTLIGVMVLNQCILCGFANPRVCMPTIMSLQTCCDERIRNLALDLHTKLFDKYESLIESCYPDGIRLQFQYHFHLNEKQIPRVLEAAKNGISGLYLFLKSSKSARRKFLSGVLRVLDSNFDKISRSHNSSTEDGMEELLGLARYVCECIAYIPYLQVQEVYQVVSGLDRLVAREGQEIIDEHNNNNTSVCVGVKAQITIMAWHLRQYLKHKFNLAEEKLSNGENSKPIQEIFTTTTPETQFTYPDYSDMIWHQGDQKTLVAMLGQVLASDSGDRFQEFGDTSND